MPIRRREISRNQPLRTVAMDETRVFTWGEKGLLVLDAATGNPIRQLDTVRPPAVLGKILLAGGRVLAQIEGGWQAFDLKTLASAWDVKVDTQAAMADDRTLAVVGPERIIAVDVATGAVRWQCEHSRPAVDKPVAAGWLHTNVGVDYVDADIVVAWLGSERWILGAADGTKRWTLGRPGRNGSPAVVARHGDVIQIGSSVCRVADGQPVRDRLPQRVGGGNCTMPLLLENFAINGKGSVIRFPDNKTESYPALRTPCNGYVPVANGLLYAVGSGCGCVPLFVRGTAAHGAARIVDAEALAGRARAGAACKGKDDRLDDVSCRPAAIGGDGREGRLRAENFLDRAAGRSASGRNGRGVATGVRPPRPQRGDGGVRCHLRGGSGPAFAGLSRRRRWQGPVAERPARGVPVVVDQCLRPEPEDSAAVLQAPQEGLVQSDLRTRGRFEQIFRGVRGLSLAFDDDLVFCGDKYKIAAFAPDHKAGQPPRLGKLSIQGGPPHAVAMAGDVVVAAQGQPDGTGKLTVCNRTDGAAVTSVPLPAPPVRDGLAIVAGAIVAVCADGSVVMTRSP